MNASDSAISGASREGHIDIVRLLLDRIPDGISQKVYSTTALHAAADAGQKDIVSACLVPKKYAMYKIP